MTAPYRKKLIEVSIPLEAINKASAKEQSIRCGHPSMLHLWWTRQPRADCLAALFALLVKLGGPTSRPDFGTTSVNYELAALLAMAGEAA